ncbi:hypothetical protein KW797_00225 [Candidatus Parcubacteria bacterium]|nr:hypothetical protein [Candidatus Parcubacteria bacterium]
MSKWINHPEKSAHKSLFRISIREEDDSSKEGVTPEQIDALVLETAAKVLKMIREDMKFDYGNLAQSYDRVINQWASDSQLHHELGLPPAISLPGPDIFTCDLADPVFYNRVQQVVTVVLSPEVLDKIKPGDPSLRFRRS